MIRRNIPSIHRTPQVQGEKNVSGFIIGAREMN
jgi:hypothetical protein